MESRFIKSAVSASQYPETDVPEVAFFGRSNTGKSTLINMLARSKTLVKTGARPGMTQLINFFQIEESYTLADLPGYGYAKVSKAVRGQFMGMLGEYFRLRTNLRLLFLLLDVRRTPNEEEFEIIEWLASLNVKTALIITKADKVTRNELPNRVRAIAETLGVPIEDLFVTSSHSGLGMKELISVIREQIL